jgi:hypothetical protein
LDIRCRSKATVWRCPRYFRFTPKTDIHREAQHVSKVPVAEVLALMCDGCSPSVANDIMAPCIFWVTRPKNKDPAVDKKDPDCFGIDYRQANVR